MGIGVLNSIGSMGLAYGCHIKRYNIISADKIRQIEQDNIDIFAQNRDFDDIVDEKELMDKLNKFFEKKETYIKLEKHDVFKNTFIIKIVDKETEDVIKEIPPKKILDMVASMCEMAGLILDEKA